MQVMRAGMPSRPTLSSRCSDTLNDGKSNALHAYTPHTHNMHCACMRRCAQQHGDACMDVCMCVQCMCIYKYVCVRGVGACDDALVDAQLDVHQRRADRCAPAQPTQQHNNTTTHQHNTSTPTHHHQPIHPCM